MAAYKAANSYIDHPESMLARLAHNGRMGIPNRIRADHLANCRVRNLSAKAYVPSTSQPVRRVCRSWRPMCCP